MKKELAKITQLNNIENKNDLVQFIFEHIDKKDLINFTIQHVVGDVKDDTAIDRMVQLRTKLQDII